MCIVQVHVCILCILCITSTARHGASFCCDTLGKLAAGVLTEWGVIAVKLADPGIKGHMCVCAAWVKRGCILCVELS